MIKHNGEKLTENDYLFCSAPTKIGKIISADSTAGKLENPRSLFYQFAKFEHFTAYTGKYGVAVCKWTKRSKTEEIILYSDKDFLKRINKYKKLKDFYNKALSEYKNCKIKHLKKDILEGKDVVLKLKGGEIILSQNRFILKTKNKTVTNLLQIEIIDDEYNKKYKEYVFVFENECLAVYEPQIVDLDEFKKIIPFFIKVYNFDNKAKIYQAITETIKEKEVEDFLENEDKYDKNFKLVPLLMVLFAVFVYLISLFFNKNFAHTGILVSIITAVLTVISNLISNDYKKELFRTAVVIDLFIFVFMGLL